MVEYSVLSQKGVSREKNEDSYAVLTGLDGSAAAFVIADGMGGHNSGEIASMKAVEYVSDKLKEMSSPSDDNIPEALEEIISAANAGIYGLSIEKRSYAGMGTTLTVCYIVGSRLYIGHIGDSRVYLARNGVIRLLTSDHTYVEELIRNGSISRSQALNHPGHNIITRAVGIIPAVKADIYLCDIIDTDTLLLCTDGLTKSIAEDEMLETVINGVSTGSICDKLLEITGLRGGQDDATVMAVRFTADTKE